MSKKQRESRAYWKKEMKKLIELSKLPPSDKKHISSALVEEILFDVPEYDITKKEKDEWYKELNRRA
jgi:hypothetical protein